MLKYFKNKKNNYINNKINATVDYLVYLRDKEIKQTTVSIYSTYINLTPMKIQTLLYLSEGLSLTKYNKGIFLDNTFHAWRYGPCIPSIHYKYSVYGQHTIPLSDSYEFSILTNEDKEIIETIWNELKGSSPYDLVTICQLGPWEDVYVEFELNNTISQESIKEFFEK